MNNPAKIATSVAVVSLGAVSVVQWRSLIADMLERFPDIDPKIVKKAYRAFLMKALTGQLEDLSNLNDSMMDKLFLAEVTRLTSN